jgi:hypothetical protein
MLLVRGNGGRHEPDFFQTTLFAAALSQKQMPVMNRVETAAKNAQTHGNEVRGAMDEPPERKLVI